MNGLGQKEQGGVEENAQGSGLISVVSGGFVSQSGDSGEEGTHLNHS